MLHTPTVDVRETAILTRAIQPHKRDISPTAARALLRIQLAPQDRERLHELLGKYIQRLVAATRPYNPDTDWLTHSPSELVERGVDLGASPRAIICWGRLAKVWALLVRKRTEVYPEDIQDLAVYVLGHRLWLGPHAASHGLTTDSVIADVIERVAVP